MTPARISKNRQLVIKSELEALFEKLGYTVISGKGTFQDGTCLLENEKKLVINVYTPLDLQLDFMLEVLSRMDLSNVFILPAIREMLDDKRTLFNS
jgi:hypothetical protein